MIKSGKRLGPRKIYSEDFKLRMVKLYESGKHSVYELEKIYDISNASIYKWIHKYSKYNKKSVKVVEFKDSQMSKINEMQTRIAELEL
ncbi:transposase [Mesonia sp.]|uniref:transposase n=1 Tax=Mesonia sp. TaxID=1960830 RepID=UPI003F9A17AE